MGKNKMFVGLVPKFRGSALKGKHRFVPPATRATRYLFWSDWRNEEEIIKYTSTPYISPEEEREHITYQLDPLYTTHIETPMQQRYASELLEKFERNRQFEIL